jgi:hypothetical protein
METESCINEREKFISIIMRQTIYSYNEAKEALEENDNNYEKVIRDALGIKEKKDREKKEQGSINQNIYKNIREFMEGVSPLLNKDKDKLGKISEEN